MTSTAVRPPSRRARRARRPAALVVAGGLALALALPACGSSSDGAASSEVELSDEAASTDVSTTEAPDDTKVTVTSEPTDTTAPIATTGMASPEEAATRLYDAWYADDRATAATIAEPDAVAAMWETARGDYSIYSGCDSAEFEVSGCLFRGANGTIQMTMERQGDLWIVTGAFYSEP